MTKDKIQLFREMYLKEVKHPIDPSRRATRGEYIRIVLDSSIEFNTQTDFVIFDDDNELIHIICANDDPLSQFDWPFKIMSASYDIVFVIESIMSKTNLDDILDDSFLGNVINDEKKEFIRTWMNASNNLHKPYPMDADPYYTQNPQSNHQGTKIIPREDGIKIASAPASRAKYTVKVVRTVETLLETIQNAEAGATITLAGDIELTETIKIEKPITLVGGTINCSAPKTFEFYTDATIRNMTIKNSANNGRCIDTRKSVNVELDNVTIETTSNSNNQAITISGDENNGTTLTLKNSSVKGGIAGYPIITFVKADITIENSTVEGYCSILTRAGSEGTTVNVINSGLIAHNVHSGFDNSFGAIALKAEDCTINIDKKSSVTATADNPEVIQRVIVLYEEAKNNTIRIENGAVLISKTLIVSESDKIDTNTIIIPEKYANAAKDVGFTVEAIKGENVVKVCDKPVGFVVNGTSYTTLAEAITAAEEGAVIDVHEDVTTAKSIVINKPITINGNGGTITGSAEKVFELYADAKISNMTINNTATRGRCIDTRKAVNVELDGVTIETTSASNNQPITISGDENEGTTLTLKNSTVKAGVAGYPIIVFVKADITVENSTIEGYCSIITRTGSEGTVVNVINSDLIAHNIHAGYNNSFGAIALRAENASINIDKDSSVTATADNEEVHQRILILYNEAKNNEVRIENGAVLNSNIIIVSESDVVDSNVITIPAEYAEVVKSNGFDVEIIEGEEIVKIKDVPAPATIDGVRYDSAEEAIAAAANNDTIELANDVSIDNPLTLDKSVHIISNGATINDKITIKEGASVILEGLNIVNNNASNTTRIIESDSANVTLKGCTLTTNSELHDIAYFKACDNIVIEDCDFSGSTNTDVYNFMEFCLNPEKNINTLTIRNCKFGACKNNVISLHSFTDDAIVTIEGCEFEYSGNAVRVSNYTAAENVAITLTNNTYHSTVEGEYAGFIFFQKQNKEGIDKFESMNVYINNLIGPNGVPMTSNGTGADQVWYTYITDDEPNVIFQ